MSSAKSTLRPERIQALQAGIAPAFALHAGVKLGVFTILGDSARSAPDIADELALPAERIQRLLHALVVAGLLETETGHFRNSAEAAMFLVRGKPGYIGDEHRLLDLLWRADMMTAESIAEGRPAAAHDFSLVDSHASVAFFQGLAPGGLAFGRQLARMIDLSKVNSVIDIGGAPGTALIGLLESKADLRATLLELPASIAAAKTLLAGEPLGNRIIFEEADIVQLPSATKHDMAILKAVIQVLSRREAAGTIRHTFESLNSGGMIYVSGAGILNDDRLSPPNAVFYDLTFMNLYREGASYTHSEYKSWLADAGFVDASLAVLPSGSQIISALKP